MKPLMILLLVASCASHKRTPYQEQSKGHGYSDKTLDGDLRMVSFKANARTKTSQAEMFAKFRTLEICQGENKKYSFILDVFDKTKSKTITRYSTSGYPSYYYGMSPFYNRYSSFSLGFSTMQSDAWNETLSYPEVEVVYQCLDQVLAPMLELREVSAEEMKHLVKDLRGGLQVELVPKESPNFKQQKVGDIILRVDGERIQEIYQLMKRFNEGKKTIQIDILRNGKEVKNVKLNSSDMTDKISTGQAGFLETACKYEDLQTRGPCKTR